MNRIQPNENNCFGCRACENICPKEAISMRADEKGFLYPEINEDLCVDCGLCRKACPFVSKHITEEFSQKAYAVIHKNPDTLKKSTSGGAFTLFANEVLKRGGMVCGCTLDENLCVSHISIFSADELDKLRGSKYVQSDMGKIHSEVYNCLKEGKPVLFSGTPCQVDSLNAFLKAKNQPTEKLLTIDILCHGVPSPKLWADFVAYLEKTYKSKLTTFKFRTKLAGWENSIETATFANGKTIKNTHPLRVFLTFFHKNISLRPMCNACPYTSYKRVSDITIGDYWGIDKTQPEINDNKGLSLVLINTEKGETAFRAVSGNATVLETKPEDAAQRALLTTPQTKYNIENFWKDYAENGFDYIAEKYGARSNLSLMKVRLTCLLYKLHLLKFFKKLM